MGTDEISLYRKSVAWKKSMQLTSDVYTITRSFPVDERFGLTNQLRRASVSIACNIAEGNGRGTSGELIYFLGMARGSAMEVLTQLEVTAMQGFGEIDDLRKARTLATEVVKMLNSSISTMRSKTKK